MSMLAAVECQGMQFNCTAAAVLHSERSLGFYQQLTDTKKRTDVGGVLGCWVVVAPVTHLLLHYCCCNRIYVSAFAAYLLTLLPGRVTAADDTVAFLNARAIELI